jgi:hypothetical protein
MGRLIGVNESSPHKDQVGGSGSRALHTIVRMVPMANADPYHYAATALSVFWPEAEYQRLLARWPHRSQIRSPW